MEVPRCKICKEKHWGPICPSAKSSRGGGESRTAAQHGVDTAGVRVPKAKADVPGLRSPAGVASGPRETKIKSSDAARAAPVRKPKPRPKPQAPKASAAASGTTTYQYRNPEERKAYLAKYMRDRRARLAQTAGQSMTASPQLMYWQKCPCVYRHYDLDGGLLYVGMTVFPQTRFGHHRRWSPWFDEIDCIKIQRFERAEDATAAEIDAIKNERPKYNKTYNDTDKKPRKHRKGSLANLKPWLAAGMSRFTWYSRQAEKRPKP